MSGVCATVKLQIDQSAVMSRSAFVGTLVIDPNIEMAGLSINLVITDEAGNVVDPSTFGITNTELTGIAALDGTQTAEPSDEVTSQYTFVPSLSAALNGPTQYNIGGTITSNGPNGDYSADLTPVTVTVLPQPALVLDYFEERNVIGDDPYTPNVVEPSQPFMLGLQVHNEGAGAADNLQIESAQPKIVDNQKGLQINFTIVGSQVNGALASDSLTADFGTVAPGATETGAWYLESTLQGKFIDYQASFTNVNPLGLNEQSIIQDVRIHELIHGGDVNGDGVVDFLANDIPDLLSAPDTLYLSDGTTAPVTVIDASAQVIGQQGNTLGVAVETPAKAAEWDYFDVLVPADLTYTITSVLRADGTALLPGQYWFTDRTFTNAATEPTYENRLHVLDDEASASYVVTFTKNAAPGVNAITLGLTNDTGISPNDKITSDSRLFGTGAPNAIVRFSIDGVAITGTAAADATGAWNFSPTGLADGVHTIVASETDGAGNTGSASLTITLDTTFPAVTEALQSDTGASATDGITTDPVITGGGDPDATIHFTLDGSPIGVTATAGPDGTWGLTPVGLPAGTHTIVASETDAAGNTGLASLTFTLETQPPILTVALSDDTGESSSDGITSNASLTGSGAANAAVQFVIDGQSVATTATVDSSGAWTFAPTGLADGTHTVVATETDVAGNVSSASLTFTLDTVSPVVAMALSDDTGASGTDGLTSDPALTGTGDPNAVVFFRADGLDLSGSALADQNGHWTFTPTGLADGTHTLVATETDAAGNTGSASLTVTLDTIPPAVTVTLASDTGADSTDRVTSNAAVTGAGDPLAVVHVSIDGIASPTVLTADASGAWSLDPTGLADGTHTITATETDAAGNTDTASLVLTLDTTAPAVTEALADDTGASATDNITATDTVTGSGDADAVVHFTVDGVASTETTTADATGAWIFTPSGLTDGTHTIVASETDLAGNVGTASLTFSLDTQALPITAVLANDTGASASDGITSVATVTGTADPDAEIHFVVDGASIGATVTADATGAWIFTPTGLADGEHTIVAQVVGLAGNTGSASVAFTLDTTAPAVTVALSSDTGLSGTDAITSDDAVIGAGDANALVHLTVDGASAAQTVTADASGHWSFAPAGLADGAHTVTATETDAAGNVGSATLSFTLDTVPPLLTVGLSSDTGASATDGLTSDPSVRGTGVTNSVVTFAIDGVSIPGWAIVDAGGTWTFTPYALADGPHVVTATETDVAGNTTTKSVSFTLDTTAPLVTESLVDDTGSSQSDGITANPSLKGTADAHALVTFTIDGAVSPQTAIADASGGWTFTPSGLNDGAHTIVASETDAAGNTGSASLSFTLDSTAPLVTEGLVIDTGSSATDDITSDDALTGIGLPNGVVHFMVDGSAVALTTTSSGSGAWTFTPTGLADGSHRVVASETDIAGNTGTVSLTFTLDTKSPTIVITSTGGFVSQLGQTITGTSSGVPSGTTVTVFEGSTPIGTGQVQGDGTWSAAASLITGADITARVTDVAGNTGASAAISYTIEKFSIQWNLAADGSWSTGSNWSTGKAPTAQDKVLISQPFTVTYDDGVSAIALLATAPAATLAVTGGSLILEGDSDLAGQTEISDGTLALNANSVLASLTQTGGTLSLTSGVTLSVGGASFGLAYSNGGTVDGPGTLSASGTTTIVDSIYGYQALTLGGGVAWTNSGTVEDGGIIAVGDASGLTASLTNQAGAVFNLTSDDAQLASPNYYGGGSSTFANAGTLAKTGGSGISHVYAALTSTGSVDAASGTLELDGGGAISGEITGAGTLAFGGGTATVAASTSLSIANLLVDGGTVSFAGALPSQLASMTVTSGSLSFAGALPSSAAFVQSGGSVALAASSAPVSFSQTGGTLSLTSGVTLGVGGASLGRQYTYGGTVDGPGTLSASGTTTIVDSIYGYQALTLGGGVAWTNSGTVEDGGIIAVGDASGLTASLTNQAGAVFNLTSDDAQLASPNYYGGGSSTFANAGTLAKTDGSGISHVYAALTSTGSVDAASGTLELDGGGAISGEITGAGTLAFGGGTATVAASTSLSIANLLVDGGTVSFAGAIPSGTDFVQTSGTVAFATSNAPVAFSQTGGDLTISAKTTLSVGGASFGLAYSNGGTVDGPGTLSASGTSTIVDSIEGYPAVTLGGGVAWTNSGTVNDGGMIAVGDNNGSTATLTNQAGATFDLTSDDAEITSSYDYTVSENGSSTFANAGTLAKTGGSGISHVYAALTNTGTVDAASGTLELDGGGTLSGKLVGSGTLAIGGGTFSASALAVTGPTILVDGGTLDLSGASSVTSFAETTGDLVLASGAKLSVGGASFGLAYSNGGTVDGPGTLATSGTSTIVDSIEGYPAVTLGGGVAWTNSGTVNDGGMIAVGDNNGSTATLTNQAGATFDLTSDDAEITSSYDYTVSENGSSTFANAGTLAKTGGSGISHVYAALTNTGTVDAASGTLELDGGGTLSGKLVGSGTLAIGGGTFSASALAVTGPTILVDGGTLDLSGASSVTSFAETTGDLVLASGAKLSVGGASFGLAYSNGGTVDGPGTLATSGTSTIVDSIEGYPAVTLGGGVAWTNSGTVNDGGMIAVGDNNGSTATLTNQAGATFDLTSDDAEITSSYDYTVSENGSSTFANAGTLAKTGGSGISHVYAALTNTGTVDAASGTLELDGGGTLSGKLVGSGTLAIGGGTFSASALAVTGPTILVDGGTLDLSGASSVTSFAETTGDLVLASGAKLSVGGASFGLAYSNGGTVDGPGTLATSGTSTIVDSIEGYPAVTLGGGVAWTNSGTVNDGGMIAVGDNNGSTATLTNQAGATFDLTSDDAEITSSYDYTVSENGSSTFANAGTLAKTGGSGISHVYAALTNTGTVDAASGTLELDGGGTLSGKLVGSGTLAIGGGTFSASALAVTGPTILVDGGTLDLSGASSVTSFAETTGDLVLASGAKLSVGGASFGLAYSNGGTVDGPGTLATSGTSTIVDSIEGYPAVTLGGGVAWTNSGTVNDGGMIAVGDNNGSTATLTNQAGATFDLTSDDAEITSSYDYTVSENGSSTFANAGTLAKTGGSGISHVYAALTNTGTVKVDSGTLSFQQSVAGNGSFDIDGSVAIDFANSVSSGSKMSFVGGSGTLQVDGGLAFSGMVQGFSLSDTIDISTVSYGTSDILSLVTDSAGTTATLTDGSHRASLQLIGSYSINDFILADDRHGGTSIIHT